jgi:hypothetical protein
MIRPKSKKFEQLNNLKEKVELKNMVKTQGVLFKKVRLAVLTLDRLLLFNSQSHFLEHKNPRVRKVTK